jgi:hypothetical protein
MMGNLLSTSTWYILIMPLFTLDQLGTPLTSSSIGDVSRSAPFFTYTQKASRTQLLRAAFTTRYTAAVALTGRHAADVIEHRQRFPQRALLHLRFEGGLKAN